ncbi:phenylacetate--CoA ligase family protein [Salinimicrobium tongyeongense]|uniref:Phenylacetate--CoA ligase family protein n=1 Tax=Salinimicrobium tongyeongense TaxID=2809707 RepID=A0ABY6NVF5_9FLAO|nr:phenylacetate--CoA ligase family protein [Salinimicrobium tongyeongense]UZH56621.1 phenylacetate--CoA ligase family protein [Salinimicrobium tongyeongense]
MNWFGLSLQLKGFPIQTARKVLAEIQNIPPAHYPAHIENKKREIVEFHLKHNPFYREFFGKGQFETWENVPLMQKKHLQRPLEERFSKGFNTRNSHVGKTSGSSGHPFIFAKDKFCHALSWAEFYDRYRWYNIDLDRSLQARFYGIPHDQFGYYRERLKDYLGRRYRFPIFDLSDKKMEAFLKDFQKKPFEYINGYTSSIVLFAKFLQKKNLVLKELCPSLGLCIVTSEMLFEEDKKLLEEVFGVAVVNEYGASETGLLAFQNTGGEMIINSETQFVEVLDEAGKAVAPGEKGRIVITSLYNKAHPFIRYEIGDSGAFAENSGPKKAILKQLFGRTNDVAVLPGGKVVPGLTFYYVTKTVIENTGKIKEFVVQQTARGSFRIIYVSGEELQAQQKKKIEAAMETYLEKGLELHFEHKTLLDRSNRGKLKQFESLL